MDKNSVDLFIRCVSILSGKNVNCEITKIIL